MKTWAAVAAFLIVPLAASGCSSGDADAGPAAATVTVTETASAEPPPAEAELEPLVLNMDEAPGSVCFSPAVPRDLAWFDVTWKANTDLDEFSFELIDPVGVKQVGGGLIVPPINFGGRIDFGGASSWDQRAKVLDDKVLFWSQRDAVWSWVPIEGQSGLLVLHLRLDDKVLEQPGGGGFDGVEATYRTADGETGTVRAEVRNAYRIGKRC